MYFTTVRRALAALAAAAALVSTGAFAGDSDNLPKGMSPDSKAARALERNDDDRRKDDRDGRTRYEQQGYREDQVKNHGQAVSECNHRANQRAIKGDERKEWVEWCVDRGERHKYDDRRYSEDRGCYRKANERGLRGDYRRVFILDCLAREDKRRDERRHRGD